MADGYFPTLVSKDEDPNLVSNPIFVKLTDGSTALSVTGNSLDVNLTNTSVPVTGTFWQTTQPISGSVSVNNGAGAAAVNIQDGGNTITVDGTVGITGTVTVSASDLDIRNLNLTDDAVKISANTTANSAGNPIYVALGSGPIAGEVHHYDTSTVSGGSPDNHDYTVVTAMLVKSIEIAASGACKAELKTGPVATLVTKWVGFIPKAGGVISAHFDPPIEVPVTSTGTVRIIRTNREGSSQDVYSTIVGIDA